MNRYLADIVCIPCRGDSLPPPEIVIRELNALVPDWTVDGHEGVPRLVRSFNFQDFAQSLDFGNQIGEAANVEDHHPAILIEYGKTTISWLTHSIHGLHRTISL